MHVPFLLVYFCSLPPQQPRQARNRTANVHMASNPKVLPTLATECDSLELHGVWTSTDHEAPAAVATAPEHAFGSETADAMKRAVDACDFEAIQSILAGGYDVDEKLGLGKPNALCHACVRGNSRSVRFLIERGATLECVGDSDAMEASALMWVVLGSSKSNDVEPYLECIETLLAAGALQCAISDSIGGYKTPLYCACGKGAFRCHDRIAQALIDGKADVNWADGDQRGATALFMAASNGRSVVVEMLLTAGASVNIATRDGISPLTCAASFGYASCVRLCIAAKADLEQIWEGKTPLACAFSLNQGVVDGSVDDCMRILLEAGADPMGKRMACQPLEAFVQREPKLMRLCARIDLSSVSFVSLWCPDPVGASRLALLYERIHESGGSLAFAASQEFMRALDPSGPDVEQKLHTWLQHVASPMECAGHDGAASTATNTTNAASCEKEASSSISPETSPTSMIDTSPAPCSLPGGFVVGERLFHLGSDRRDLDYGYLELTHGAQGRVIGRPCERGDTNDRRLLEVEFGIDPKTGRPNLWNIPCERLSREPPPPLPGGFLVGERAYFIDPNDVFYGEQCQVLGPAFNLHCPGLDVFLCSLGDPTLVLSMSLAELSRTKPPPVGPRSERKRLRRRLVISKLKAYTRQNTPAARAEAEVSAVVAAEAMALCLLVEEEEKRAEDQGVSTTAVSPPSRKRKKKARRKASAAQAVEEAAAEASTADAPPTEAPLAEAPLAEAPLAEAPLAEAPSAEAPSAGAPAAVSVPVEVPATVPAHTPVTVAVEVTPVVAAAPIAMSAPGLPGPSAQRSLLKSFEELPEDFVCPITQELMQDPVFASDGHTYERSALVCWLKVKNTSPKTGMELEHAMVFPNHMARSMIREWQETQERTAVDVTRSPSAPGLPALPAESHGVAVGDGVEELDRGRGGGRGGGRDGRGQLGGRCDAHDDGLSSSS